ncbi:MAG: hypothetical protein MUP98_03265 [Candidatus Aminicenantes bacterium]|nr:hypothetical protein [Candidatus Aminicenantes bacterium]
MEPVVFEDEVKYDLWLKIILVGSIVVLIAMGIMFSVDAYSRDILPEEPMEDSKIGAIILFVSAVFVFLVLRAVLPRKLFILRDKIRINSSFFSFIIPFSRIESYDKATGFPIGNYLISSTSLKNQIEIFRKSGLRIRVSPCHMDLFLEALDRAVKDWVQYQPK